jgi:hypothetical protein
LLLAAAQQANRRYPQIIHFETFIDTEQIDEVGLQHRDGKLRIVPGASVQKLSGPMIERHSSNCCSDMDFRDLASTAYAVLMAYGSAGIPSIVDIG